jgi:rhamnosyltransferase
MRSIPLRIAAIFTAYHPRPQLVQAVGAAARSCDKVIVVDNTPAHESTATIDELKRMGALVLTPGVNLGLAGALNLAIEQLGDDVDAVLFLDQDSELPPGTVEGLAWLLHTEPTIGIASPAPWLSKQARYLDPITNFRSDVADVPLALTSGMMVRTSALRQIGSFRADFFVDMVDVDYCIRAHEQGIRLVQDKRLKLPHQIGEVTEHRILALKLITTNHAPWRLYWVFRNGVVLIRTPRRASLNARFMLSLLLVKMAAATLLFERTKRERLHVIARGLRDGMSGRADPRYLPASARRPRSTLAPFEMSATSTHG